MLLCSLLSECATLSRHLLLQEFPADQPGKYINKLDLGLLKAKLLAEYEYVADNKINVKFVDITFFLGPFQLNRVRVERIAPHSSWHAQCPTYICPLCIMNMWDVQKVG